MDWRASHSKLFAVFLAALTSPFWLIGWNGLPQGAYPGPRVYAQHIDFCRSLGKDPRNRIETSVDAEHSF